MFEITDDDYCLKPEQWYQLSADMEASAPTFPAAFGDKIKRIDHYISTWRASDLESIRLEELGLLIRTDLSP